jgi:hypothetical protein
MHMILLLIGSDLTHLYYREYVFVCIYLFPVCCVVAVESSSSFIISFQLNVTSPKSCTYFSIYELLFLNIVFGLILIN